MITEKNLLEYILEIEPDFRNTLEDCRNSWGLDASKLTVGIQFIEFSDFVCEKFKKGSYSNAKKVFDGIEFLLQDQNSDEKVQTLVTTCFLENMQNLSSNELFSPGQFVPFLGPESAKYCKAWDEFTGVETPGLWGSERPQFKSRNKLEDKEAVAIIKSIKNREYEDEKEEDRKIKLLELNLPGISNLLFYDRRDLTPAQILEEAKNNSKPRKG
jgi:hypothetical protein